jgi:lipopolysaccharide export system permease protein
MILRRYIFFRFCTSAFFALSALLILFSVISLVEVMEDVGQGNFTPLHAFLIILFETPNRIIELLPIVTLLGAITGLGSLANNQEIAAARSAGMSVLEFVKVFIFIIICLSLITVLIQAYLIPGSEKQVLRLKSFSIEQTDITEKGFWSKKGPAIIRIEEMTSAKTATSIEIYDLSNQGNLEGITIAESAAVGNKSIWFLDDVTTRIVSPSLGLVIEKRTNLTWNSFLKDSQLKTLTNPLHSVSAFDLARYVRTNQGSGLDTRAHEVVLWQRLVFPINLLAMALIGISLVFSSVKTRSSGSHLLIAAGIGVFLYLLQQTTGHLSTLLNVSPVITVCMPPLAIASVAIHTIRKI